MKLSSKVTFAGLSILLMVSFNNCSDVKFSPIDVEIPSTDLIAGGDNLKMSITPGDGFVCSPFGTTTIPSDKAGLKAELRYIPQASALSAGDKNAFLSTDYFNDANTTFEKAAQAIYLSDVNVPTRKFEVGFASSDGTYLSDSAGNKLIEYFALRMDSVLVLGPNDLEGYYELATVSDDGTVIQAYQNNAWSTIISNDGAHSTKMGCGSGKIQMTKQSRIPIRIFYNQGPRTQIANVLIWNYRGPTAVTAADVTSDTDIHLYCGKSDNNKFWSSEDSTAADWYKDLVAEKWKILAPVNFQLPDNEVNPCSYNKYDLSPELTSTDQKNLDLSLKEAAAIEVKVYLVDAASGAKMLIQTINKPADVHHNFEISSVDVKAQYKLDIVSTIENKKVKVLKDYTVKFEKQP